MYTYELGYVQKFQDSVTWTYNRITPMSLTTSYLLTGLIHQARFVLGVAVG